MKLKEEYEKLLSQRTAIKGEVDYEKSPIIKQMVMLMTKDINETIHFIDTECSGEQFVWLSEIFDEIAETSKSSAFIDALRRTANKYPKETQEYNLTYFIDSASEYVKSEG